MFSKRAATTALTFLSFRPAVAVAVPSSSSRLATRASVRSLSSSSAAWIRTGGRYGQAWTVVPTVKRGERIQGFSVSARLSKEAAARQDGSFKQYGFEDISSALPSSSASSPPSTPILIDVREPSELTATGIIPTAVCMPLKTQPDALFLSEDEFLTRFGYPKPTAASSSSSEKGASARDLVFYCRAGVRAKTAAQLAVQAGYDPARIGVYEGSWLDWEKRRGEVERWQGFE